MHSEQDGSASHTQSRSSEQPNRRSLDKACIADAMSTPSRTAAVRGKRTGKHRDGDEVVYTETAAFFKPPRLEQQQSEHRSDSLMTWTSKPTDTVRGIIGSDTSECAVPKLSSSSDDLCLEALETVDQNLLRGIAAWSDGDGIHNEDQEDLLTVHAESDAEARAIMKKTLRAHGAFNPNDY